MESITRDDLSLINSLSQRVSHGNQLSSNATNNEENNLVKIKDKLRTITNYFFDKYNDKYGPFKKSISSGNPIAIGGTKFKRVWSGIYKGAKNKQYAAQISFVMDPNEEFLDVGFYFGLASGHSFTPHERVDLESQLKSLGNNLSNNILGNPDLNFKYNSLFEYGFKSYSKGQAVLPEEWLEIIRNNPKNSQIIFSIYPNDFNIIENSTIDFFVSTIIFLMGMIDDRNDEANKILIRPLTPIQIVKQAERLAEIGQKGELFVIDYEKEKLKGLGFDKSEYPKHVSLESMHYGYDILSLDVFGKEIYIEVKTTTRNKDDYRFKLFFLSTNEYKTFTANKSKYNLYRVYDIEENANFEILDLEQVIMKSDGYIVEY